MNDSWDELKKEFQKYFFGLCVQEPWENEIRAYLNSFTILQIKTIKEVTDERF